MAITLRPAQEPQTTFYRVSSLDLSEMNSTPTTTRRTQQQPSPLININYNAHTRSFIKWHTPKLVKVSAITHWQLIWRDTVNAHRFWSIYIVMKRGPRLSYPPRSLQLEHRLKVTNTSLISIMKTTHVGPTPTVNRRRLRLGPFLSFRLSSRPNVGK